MLKALAVAAAAFAALPAIAGDIATSVDAGSLPDSRTTPLGTAFNVTVPTSMPSGFFKTAFAVSTARAGAAQVATNAAKATLGNISCVIGGSPEERCHFCRGCITSCRLF